MLLLVAQPPYTGIQNMTCTRGGSPLTARDIRLMDYNVYPLPPLFDK